LTESILALFTFLGVQLDLSIRVVCERAFDGFDITVEAQVQLLSKAVQKEGGDASRVDKKGNR
jgi:hypothetical protein